MFYPVFRKFLPVFFAIIAIIVSAYIGYSCGLKKAPQVQCSMQVEHELLRNSAFRGYVNRIYGDAFKKEIDEYLVSPTVESIILDWLRTEAPLCRSPKAGGVKHNPAPTKADFQKVFTTRVK